ncbi:MAG TPA: hypothetical protein VFG20_15970 [Planctomycetaceae bacterium]|nr:hypothetical protein [Planctomycetaceae bacterium]
MSTPIVETEEDRLPPARGTFWSRHKTLVNFWLDCSLMMLFLVQSWLVTVVTLVFPRGGNGGTIWGATAGDWLDALFVTSCVFAVGVVLHVMLHWSWICGTISMKLLGRKAGKDDGTQTLIGVGFLILLLHILGAAILAAKVGLVRSL